MRLVTFRGPDGADRFGALADEETVVDLTATGSPFLADALAFFDGGDAAREAAESALTARGSAHALSDVTLLAPVPRPRSIRDFMAFEKHILQATRTVTGWHFKPLLVLDRLVRRLGRRGVIKVSKVWYEQPVYYKSNAFSVVGPEADVRMPSYTSKFDYELEFGIFIGKAGRDISAENAREHIAGYTIFNDFSARDAQMREITGRLGPAKGKDFDTGNVLGPWLVTADEIPDPYDLTMVARVNGREMSRGTTRDMHWTFEQIIEHASRDETLHPGEFIGSGTVGDGCGLEFDRYLSVGDVVELEVDRLGTLRNRVVSAG